MSCPCDDQQVRTTSLNGRMGGGDAADAATYGVANTTVILGPSYQMFKKTSQIFKPSPCSALTFLDESVNTVDDGYFAMSLTAIWQNSPTIRQYRGATLPFADGHAERWGWRGLAIEQAWQAASTPATANDLRRLQDSVAVP